MGLLPFEVPCQTVDAFQAFVAESINWLEISVTNEIFVVHGKQTLSQNQNIESLINEAEPRCVMSFVEAHDFQRSNITDSTCFLW